MFDALIKKVEDKTNIDKNTILELANKLQNGNMKDENTLRELIDNISTISGKTISEEKKQKIINTIINDKVPKNIDKMI